LQIEKKEDSASSNPHSATVTGDTDPLSTRL